MATVLSISSQVARGAIGNSAARFALQRLGHHVWDLPTIILSNHPGHPGYAGNPIEPGFLGEMVDALDDNGWLGEVDAVLTGYMPSQEHAVLAARTVDRVRAIRADAFHLCDPALGDEPKGVYIDEAAATAIQEELLPRASIATPNCFELNWLAGLGVGDVTEAVAAARSLGLDDCIATSIPGEKPDMICNILVTRTRA